MCSHLELIAGLPGAVATDLGGASDGRQVRVAGLLWGSGLRILW